MDDNIISTSEIFKQFENFFFTEMVVPNACISKIYPCLISMAHVGKPANTIQILCHKCNASFTEELDFSKYLRENTS